MNIIFTVLFFLCPVHVWAGQVSLIEHNGEADKKQGEQKSQQQVKPEPADQGFDQMKEFMQQENERLKAIKILNLDLERANLELKKKEIEVKLTDLNKTGMAPSLSAHSSQPAVMNVSGIFVNGNSRWALMNVDGTRIQVQEGQAIRGTTVVKKINANAVTVQYSNGKQETIDVR